MPKPTPGESQKDYIPRCISMLMHEKPDRDHKQAIAICYSMYRNKKNENQEILINKIDIYLGEMRFQHPGNFGINMLHGDHNHPPIPTKESSPEEHEKYAAGLRIKAKSEKGEEKTSILLQAKAHERQAKEKRKRGFTGYTRNEDKKNESIGGHIQTKSVLQQRIDDIRLRLNTRDPDDPECKYMRAELRELSKQLKVERAVNKTLGPNRYK
jgi:hypothetical protein